MNILVTGAKGQLGSHMRLLGPLSRHRYLFTDVEELDITNRDAVNGFVERNSVDCIVNCAAYTNVELAEDEESKALRINAAAVRILADAMHERGGWLFHVSTDYVFGGDKYNTPCGEELPTNPVGAYGRTKLAGEDEIKASGCHYIIIRTAWLYSEYGKNFVKTMLTLTGSKPMLNVVYDQVGSPTYAGDLARAMFQIIEDGRYEGNDGIYNYSNEGVCSWYDLTKEIARQSGNAQCNVQPCRSSEFPSKVTRPSYSVLDKSKIKRVFGVAVPYWVDSLQECIDNIQTCAEGGCGDGR